MSGWDRAKELAEKHSQAGSIFVRLQNDGDKVVGAFVGDVHPREVHWTGESYEECVEDCAHCAQGTKTSLRVACNFFVPAENAMKVIEGGTVWFGTVLTVREKYGTDHWLFEIKRLGKAKDPKTTYSILPETKIDDAMRARIAAARPHNLMQLGRDDFPPAPEPAKGATPSSSATAATITPEEAAPLMEKLKQLPREEVGAFMATFRITRLRELRRADLDRAHAYVANALAPPAPADDSFF